MFDQDSIFGARLTEAVKAFQRNNALSPIDGIVGGGTWEVLTTRTPMSTSQDFTTPPSASENLYKFGSTGSKVTQIQRRLWATYSGTLVTGTFLSNTETYTKAFQGQKDLEPDGQVGPATWSALFPTLKEGWSGKPDIKALQTLLNYRGFNCGTPDGIFGPGTTSAVTAFQSRNSLTPDGVAGGGTCAALCKN